MAIKNKDGTLYEYSKPNPLMHSQILWPKDEKIIFHNKFGKKYSPPKPEPIVAVEHIPTDIIKVWCLPATITTNTDSLYGSDYNRIKFGEKLVLDAKIYEMEDLYLKLITKETVSKGSILFPQDKNRRWWRAVSSELYEEGSSFWLITSQISDYEPNFNPS